MQLRKSKVSMAVAATLGMACLAPAASFGVTKYSVNTQNGAIPPGFGTLNASSRGDTLLFPFYTVANSAISNFSLTNTSDTQVVVAKVRFREQMHSVDVLDMHVILSPHDKFDFWLQDDGPNGRPMMHWDDNSCVVGPPSGAKSVEFNEAWQPFVTTDAQMRVGHMEVLGVVDLHDTILKPFAIHANGVPNDCGTLAQIIKSPASVAKLNTDDTTPPVIVDHALVSGGYGKLHSVDNVLVGRYIITIPGQGMEAGGDAIAIRDTNMADPILEGAPLPFGKWYATAQSSAPCSDNCRGFNLYAWDQSEWAHPHLGEMQNLAGFQRALGAIGVTGDWSNNPANRVNADWVVSFPSKYAYMDYVNGQWVMLYHPTGQDWLVPFFGSLGLLNWQTSSDGVWPWNSDLKAVFSVFGTEENSTGGVSPGDPIISIPNEMNVIGLHNETVSPDPMPSIIQVNGGDELSRQTVAFKLPNANRGWARMALRWPTQQVIDFDPLLDPIDPITGLVIPTPGSVCTGGAAGLIYADINPKDGVCDDLYHTSTGATDPTRPYVIGDVLDTKPDAVNCNWSADLCTPPFDAVTGIIFTTRATSDPTQNDASLTDLQKYGLIP